MIATAKLVTPVRTAEPSTTELIGIVRRRRSTAGRLDALSRLERERSRLVRQTEWRAGHRTALETGVDTIPVTPS